jgi:hypothetical protein
MMGRPWAGTWILPGVVGVKAAGDVDDAGGKRWAGHAKRQGEVGFSSPAEAGGQKPPDALAWVSADFSM